LAISTADGVRAAKWTGCCYLTIAGRAVRAVRAVRYIDEADTLQVEKFVWKWVWLIKCM
jgi:hypothetical protein